MNEKEKGIKKIEEEITKAIGDADEQALVRAIGALKTHTKTLDGVNQPNTADLETLKRLDILIEHQAHTALASVELLEKLQGAIEGIKIPRDIKVKNFPKQADKVTVKNFPDNVFELKKPNWYKREDIVTPISKVIIEGLNEVLKQGRNVGKVEVVNRMPKDSIPVRLTDKDAKNFYTAIASAVSTGSSPSFKDASGDSQRALVDSSGYAQITLQNQLVSEYYDFIDLGYTGSNMTTVVYKSGGSGGTTVATLTLTYDVSDNLDTVTKS